MFIAYTDLKYIIRYFDPRGDCIYPYFQAINQIHCCLNNLINRVFVFIKCLLKYFNYLNN